MQVNQNLAPVVLFIYNRPKHTKATIESLLRNPESTQCPLFIYADAPKADAPQSDWLAVNEVRALVREMTSSLPQVKFVEANVNKGLANSIIEGVTQVVNAYGKVIVLEDDLELSPCFLAFMNAALNQYEHTEQVMHVSGYMLPLKTQLPPVFFYNSTTCWGWATWRRAWQHFEPDANLLYQKIQQTGNSYTFNIDGSYDYLGQLLANVEGKLKTWAVKWYASVFLRQGLCLHPAPSYVRNIGHDGSGVHCKTTDLYHIPQLNERLVYPLPTLQLQESKLARQAAADLFLTISGTPPWMRWRSRLARRFLPESIRQRMKQIFLRTFV